ncbi:MAG: pyruvate, phosphate dikinase, partial [Candidatus Hydrogenedentes bacterium]|nr:pyruvate, phosphate dikinase [Candidatus Hydrogenedentota bacterium]
DMLDYFGQSPIIVRSSSLLEDNFGNSFAGKYDSVFCANQGPPSERLASFISAVKTVYASTMSQPALSYRARFDLLDRDEQMALLVQRVSGAQHGRFYFPQIAGVAFSFNPYVWNRNIDPEAGMLRLVFGLGTRAVDRADDDYTRLVALNAPDRRPEADAEGVPQHSQHKVDVIDLEENALATTDFSEVVNQSPDIPMRLFSGRDRHLVQLAREQRLPHTSATIVRFERLLSKTSFVQDMRAMLDAIENAYDYPVDVEFTANFESDDAYKINLVQCRPLQVKGAAVLTDLPDNIAEQDIVLETAGPVIGQGRIEGVGRIVYVVPSRYGRLPVNDRYAVARLIGRINQANAANDIQGGTMLLGPGRWGTTTPALGVPVSFAEINTVTILCEIVAMRDDLVPDVSFGTHFFSELVEMDMLYLALFPNQEGNRLNTAFFEGSPNRLVELVPDAARFEDTVRVIDVAGLPESPSVRLRADVLKQHVLCYIER